MWAKNTGFKVGYLTDPGRHRNLNEDSVYVNGDIGLFIVADGMGGHNAGEVASSIAVTVVSNLIEEGLASTKDPIELVKRGMSKANETILEKSLNNAAWNEMGTTILVALFVDNGLVIGHVGDSRAYSIGKGQIRQLTQDHTFVAEWLREGRITKKQARSHHQRHGLTEALGVIKDVGSEITVLPWERLECLLLCSDGLTEMIEDQEILTIIESAGNPQQACANLVTTANQKGGRDNITVILVCPD
ncbi:MAG: Stp1/IreP family PP2C-type Ser/Thr phosphatase [Desulfomonilaceae bacterium]